MTSKQIVTEVVLSALGRLTASGKISAELLPAFVVEEPADFSHGDLSCNAALVSAKVLKKKPREIAELINGEILQAGLHGTGFEKSEIAGPGFINFYAGSKFYSDKVKEILTQGTSYGTTNLGGGKRVLIEFVSANPTGPMHIGNARGGAIGDCLASVMEYAGYYVEREFYVNDAGNQVNKLGLSLDCRYREILGETVTMPEDSYLGEDIAERAKEFFEEFGSTIKDLPEEERRTRLAGYAMPKNINALEDDLLRYRIKYDNWFRESTLHNNGEALKIAELLKEKGHTYEKDGAVWFSAEKFGADKDIVLIRSNGVPTYIVPDIAYHYNKLVTRKFDIAIDILGADHHGYVPRMYAALSALGINTARLKFIIMQMVRLIRGGEAVKLSKRSGKAITLVTLLDEVPIDAARFFFNLRDANTHLDFDLDLAIEESSKNPVYYVQYAHARICRLFEKFEQSELTGEFVYTETAEKLLVKKLANFPEEINEAASSLDPSKITRYAYELAQSFHKFYDGCRIKDEPEEIVKSRLALCKAAKIVLNNILGLLKVNAPEKM